jgi:hypothetical protein
MWPSACVLPMAERLLYNGNMLHSDDLTFEAEKKPESGDKIRVYDSHGHFCAVYSYDGRHRMFKNEKMFV